jgi:hypothetical protein
MIAVGLAFAIGWYLVAFIQRCDEAVCGNPDE